MAMIDGSILSIVLAHLIAPGLLGLDPNAPDPTEFQIADDSVILSLHAQGAQIYECKPNAAGALLWIFREPIAALIEGSKTVGYHAAGPRWVLDDGAMVMGQIINRRDGRTAGDIAELELKVTERSGVQPFSQSTRVLRVETAGGMLQGSCDSPGALRAVAYSATYLFLR